MCSGPHIRSSIYLTLCRDFLSLSRKRTAEFGLWAGRHCHPIAARKFVVPVKNRIQRESEGIMSNRKYGVLRGRVVATAEERRDPKSHHYQITVVVDGEPWRVAVNVKSAATDGGSDRGIVLYNLVEQDHRSIKRWTSHMLGFKNFCCARILPTGIELMHMILKGPVKVVQGFHLSAADQVCNLTI
ncbi:DUF2278 family protein [Paraburkholderia sp. NPDC080076]|uniref:DUF2278 family protein n=1 Tax=Paraburkholderia sp. NPDC080076 TaxID=3390605 RepID=UPI003D03D310